MALNFPDNPKVNQVYSDPTAGFYYKWDGTSWEIIEDQRGTYYDIPSGISQENYNPLIAPENTTKEQPPEVSEGKILRWNDGWVLEDIPPPPVLTPIEKLANAGLTVDELKSLLGLQ